MWDVATTVSPFWVLGQCHFFWLDAVDEEDDWVEFLPVLQQRDSVAVYVWLDVVVVEELCELCGEKAFAVHGLVSCVL